MRRISVFILICLFLGTAFSVNAARLHHAPAFRHRTHQEDSGAQAPQPAQQTREINNKYFSIVLPDGWQLRRPVNPMADRVSAEFMKGKNVRVAINIFKVPFTRQLMAEKTAENMRKRGMDVSQPVDDGKFSVVTISRDGVKGKGWFGSDGSTGASTVIFAPDLTEANELLQALKPAIPNLVPESVN